MKAWGWVKSAYRAAGGARVRLTSGDSCLIHPLSADKKVQKKNAPHDVSLLRMARTVAQHPALRNVASILPDG